MNTTTIPASRFGWQGQTVEYTVKAKGASELAVPRDLEEGLDVRVLDTQKVADGVEARVAVRVAGPVLY